MHDASIKLKLPHGERHSRAKLTKEKVRVIRASTQSNVVLARLFGVDDCTIANARDGTSWKSTD